MRSRRRFLGPSKVGRWVIVAAVLVSLPAFAPSQPATLGFEDASLWLATTGSLSNSTTRVEGAGSLAWTGLGFAELTSTLLGTSAGIGTTASYQVRMPATAPDPNFRGETQLYLTSVSKGINHQFIGTQSMAAFPLGQFRTVTFTIPSSVRQALSGTVNDIRVHVVINAPQKVATYLLDDLRLGLAAPPAIDDVALARRVMSFESLPDWSVSGPATIAGSTVRSGGTAALAVATSGGFISITSRPLASAPGLAGLLALDVMLPDTQPNPSWFGAAQLYINAPSAGINNQFASQFELTGLQTGVFTTVKFALSAENLEKLRGRFDDLSYTVVLNVPTGASRTYVIDELRYMQVPTAVVGSTRTPGQAPVDIAGIDPATGTLTISTTRDGVVSDPIQIVVPQMVGSQATASTDLDGNGTADIVFVNPRTRSIGWLPRIDPVLPSYNLTRIGTIDATTPMGQPGQIACADIDGDTDVDCVASFSAIDPDSGVVSVVYAYLNQGSATSFTRVTLNLGFQAGIELAGKALADFDGNGRADLAVFAAGRTSDNNQVFVFPATGNATAPFSSSQRITIPSTNLLTTLDQPLWGSLAVIDADGDHHPDLWALGNRGLLLTIRSLGGTGFATPEFGGTVPDATTPFDIIAGDITGDRIPDLITSIRVSGFPPPLPIPPGPSLPPIITPGAGGGRILIRIPQPKSFPKPMPGISIYVPPTFILPPAGPQDVGLVKGNPVVTSYFDDRFVERPDIFMQGINGHLLERFQFVQITRTAGPPGPTDTLRPIRGNPLGGGGSICLPSFCDNLDPFGARTAQPTGSLTETRLERWAWVDHGTPPGTIVDSQPSVFATAIGWTQVREVFVRGLDGHLWQLELKSGARQWIDRGLPPRSIGAVVGGSPSVPLVGSPSVAVNVSETIGQLPQAMADVYALDAIGNLDHFQWSSVGVATGGTPSSVWLPTLGPIGSNNCVGAIGHLGSGSPAAMTWYGDDNRVHKQVVVVSAEGDLFSWRDGVWEEALTTSSSVVTASPRTPVVACPNVPFRSVNSGQVRQWKKAYTVGGTPSTLVWYAGGNVNRTIAVSTPWQERLPANVGSGDLREYHYGLSCQGESVILCALKTVLRPGETVVAATQAAPPLNVTPPSLPIGPIGTSFITPFTNPEDTRFRDLFVAPPGLVQDTNGDVVTLAHTRLGDLTVLRRCDPGIPCPPTGGLLSGNVLWNRHITSRSDPDKNLNELAYSPAAIMRGGEMTIFSTKSRGYLTSIVEQPGNNPFQGTDHPPDSPPVVFNNKEGLALGCGLAIPGEQIFPQWVAEQRDLSGRPDILRQLYPDEGEQNGGFESEKVREVEGVIVGSAISTLDNPTDHTVGAVGEIPQIHHDWNLHIQPDVKYQALLSDANVAEGGTMEIEWELGDDMLPVNTLPAVGDRVAIRGRHIFDCGHPPFRREIHPPQAIAFIHGNVATVVQSKKGGPSWYQPNDENLSDPLPVPVGLACDTAGNISNLIGHVVSDITAFGSEGIRDVLFAAGVCQRRSGTPLTAVGPGIETSCQFPYDHAMTDILGDDAPFEFDVPLPKPAGTNPTLPTTDFQATFVATPEPHFHVSFTPQALAVNTLFGNQTLRFAATWGGQSPPPRFFNVCFQRQALIGHDDMSIGGEVVAGVAAGAILFGIVGGPGGAIVGGIVGGLLVGSECEGDDSDEVVLYGSVNDQTVRLNPSGETCLPFAARVRNDETLQIRAAGFECDFSCSEHWDDEFFTAPNDRVGSVQMAFTQAQNFGVSGVGIPASYQMLSQPDLASTKSRHFSAGDYRMTVRITEAFVGLPP